MSNYYNLLVCGGRDFSNMVLLHENIVATFGELITDLPIRIVSGMARGADLMAHTYAKHNGIPVLEMPADWNTYGKGAGFKRNREMIDISHGVLAFWDSQSRGTADTINRARRSNMYLKVVKY